MTALCAGNPDLFESTDPGHHLAAARICGRCDFIDTCRQIRDERTVDGALLLHHGTWAGELWVNGKRAPVRTCVDCGEVLTRTTWRGRPRIRCAEHHKTYRSNQ